MADEGTNPAVQTDGRSRRVVVLATGAAVLSVGAFAALQMSGGSTERMDTGGLAPMQGMMSTSTSAVTPVSPTSVTASAQATTTAPSPAATRTSEPEPTKSRSVKEEIAKARAKAAAEGFPLMRPLKPKPRANATGDVTVTNEGSLKEDGATLRVVSAKFDLTGQRELLWAADEGRKVGSARCTQNFKLSNDAEPRERPTMLLCWRTSAGKSVATVSVVKHGRPVAKEAVAELTKRWQELG